MPAGALAVALALAVAGPAPVADAALARGPLWPGAVRLADARAYARSRSGQVSFAVTDRSGRTDGLDARRVAPSASLVKALLLVAALRRLGDRPVPASLLAELDPMVRRSQNRAARRIFAQVGRAGLQEAATAAGMRSLLLEPALFDTGVSARDMARLFLRIDTLVPARHRDLTRRLLAGVVPRQRWGIPDALRASGLAVLLKGGWRRGLVHQAALLESPAGGRVAVAVLTTGDPSERYGRATIAGIAARLFVTGASATARRPPTP
jgi:hypothetical protein